MVEPLAVDRWARRRGRSCETPYVVISYAFITTIASSFQRSRPVCDLACNSGTELFDSVVGRPDSQPSLPPNECPWGTQSRPETGRAQAAPQAAAPRCIQGPDCGTQVLRPSTRRTDRHVERGYSVPLLSGRVELLLVDTVHCRQPGHRTPRQSEAQRERRAFWNGSAAVRWSTPTRPAGATRLRWTFSTPPDYGTVVRRWWMKCWAMSLACWSVLRCLGPPATNDLRGRSPLSQCHTSTLLGQSLLPTGFLGPHDCRRMESRTVFDPEVGQQCGQRSNAPSGDQ